MRVIGAFGKVTTRGELCWKIAVVIFLLSIPLGLIFKGLGGFLWLIASVVFLLGIFS